LNGLNNQKMTRFRIKGIFWLLLFLLASSSVINAQIIAPSAKYVQEIYPDENVFIFCSSGPESNAGSLTAHSYTGDSAYFTWEFYDTLSTVFIPFNGNILEDSLQSTISNLANGLYRVTIHSKGTVKDYQAHVINNWIKVTRAEIPDTSSTCDGFQILSDYTSAPLLYFDFHSGKWEKIIRKSSSPFLFTWLGNNKEYYGKDTYVPPIASKDPVEFKLTIIDEFGCEGNGSVKYYSKVPKSGFEADPLSGEAVLKVTFKNTSIPNYDSILWCFYKSDNIIKMETEKNNGKPIDSIDFVLLENAPVYEYEWCGIYRVKVITVKVNPTTGNCYDTLYMKKGEYITVDTSLVEAPNVITPNGDGKNDEFVVKTQSLISMSISIYNRWGGLVHSWSYSNIRGRDYTYEHSVWDGKIGGRLASPGVYFYVIRAVGRDGHKQNKEGFFHLFRNKD
jgi:gliding motility-associated-like protein